MKEFAMWYIIGALTFVVFGIFRAIKYKINHDELTVISWFIGWPIWLLGFLIHKFWYHVIRASK